MEFMKKSVKKNNNKLTLLIQILLSILFIVKLTNCVDLELEAEDSDVNGGSKMSRSQASNGYTVWLHEGYSLSFYFYLHSSCQISVTNIAYTNDGQSDTILLTIDEENDSSFQTVGASNYGNNWNVVRESGTILNMIDLEAGSHVLKVTALSTDSYGVEIDNVILDLNDDCVYIRTDNLFSIIFVLEAEDGDINGGNQMARSSASNEATVLLYQENAISFSFNTLSSCTVSVINVAYTNDGESDTIGIILGQNEDNFQTVGDSDYGNDWNEVQNSGVVLSSTNIDAGSYVLTVNALNTDSYGVEVDSVWLGFNGCEADEIDFENLDGTAPPSSLQTIHPSTLNTDTDGQTAPPSSLQTIHPSTSNTDTNVQTGTPLCLSFQKVILNTIGDSDDKTEEIIIRSGGYECGIYLFDEDSSTTTSLDFNLQVTCPDDSILTVAMIEKDICGDDFQQETVTCSNPTEAPEKLSMIITPDKQSVTTTYCGSYCGSAEGCVVGETPLGAGIGVSYCASFDSCIEGCDEVSTEEKDSEYSIFYSISSCPEVHPPLPTGCQNETSNRWGSSSSCVADDEENDEENVLGGESGTSSGFGIGDVDLLIYFVLSCNMCFLFFFKPF